jgi:hypothetical protein
MQGQAVASRGVAMRAETAAAMKQSAPAKYQAMV